MQAASRASTLASGCDGVLEVEDQAVARDRRGLLQRTFVGRGHVEDRSARAERVLGHRFSPPRSRVSAVDRVVLLLQLGVDRGELVGEGDHHLALLDRRVVLHLAVDHHRTGPVTHGGDDQPGVLHVLHRGAEHPVGDGDLLGVQRPGPDAAEQEGVAELVLAGDGVGDVAERPVVGVDPVHRARVDHPRDRVVPQVLLVRRALSVDVPVGRVLAHQVARVPATDARRLHPAVGCEVGRSEREALHARAGPADLLDVHHATCGLEDRVHQERLLQPGPGLELRQQPVDVVDVLGALDLGDHDHVELVADLGDQGGQVVERPRGVERVDPGPELGGPEVDLLADLDQTGTCGLLVLRLDGVLEVAQEHVGLADHVRDLAGHLRVARVEEVDRPRRAGGDLAEGLGGSDGEWGEEVLGRAHGADASSARATDGMTQNTPEGSAGAMADHLGTFGTHARSLRRVECR